MDWAARHPVLLGVGITVGAVTVVAYWQAFLIVAFLAALAYILYRGTKAYDRRYQLERYHRRVLEWDADTEHLLLLNGDPRGVYGRYPPYQ